MDEILRTLMRRHLVLEGSAGEMVLADVADFVCAQVASMPSFLGVPYQLVLDAFDLLPFLRWGRRFSRLGETAKASYLESWSDGRVWLARDFVKVIRSCAVLAYFDHPVVRERLSTSAAVYSSLGESR
jgi:hypothetical protein